VLILTSMTRTALPLLRYWTGDITRLLPPTGGRTVRRMDMIQGRSDDMIVLRGVNVYPSQIEAALSGLADLRPHYLLVLSRSGHLDELHLRVEASRQDAALHAEVLRVIKDRVGVTISCELCEDGSLPRSEGGKLRRVQDLRGAR
jgi:phenylacetate-CoA ligase